MKRVLITGGSGFIGTNLFRELTLNRSEYSVMTVNSKNYDLRNREEVKRMFAATRPEQVYHCAALVGGIYANMTMKGKFFYENIMMNTMVMEQARDYGVEKMMVLGSGCIYPKLVEQPITEDKLWDGYPEETNAPYAFAKRASIIQSQAYKEQYGFNSITVMPGNVLGPYDNFHLEHSHVVPALIKKFSDAVKNREETVTVWGDGSPTRDFVYAPDLVRVMVDLMEQYDSTDPVNVSTAVETSMTDLVHEIQALTEYNNTVIWDTSKPNGQPRRWFDCSKLEGILGYKPTTNLTDGLIETIRWYNNNIDSIRLDKK